MSTISSSTTSTTAYKVTADTTGTLVFQTGASPTTAMTIDTSQNVGIGTSSPIGKFSAQGPTQRAGFNAGSLTSPVAGNLYYETDGTGWQFQIGKYQSSSFTAQMCITDSGNVGIGTSSPDFLLQLEKTAASAFVSVVSGTSNTAGILLGDTDSAAIGRVEYDNAGNFMALYTNGSERARIDSSGHLLVGATSGGSYSSCAMTLSTNSGTTKWDMGPYSTATNFLISSGTGGVVLSGTATSWSGLSDERVKTALTPFENAAQKICTLRAGTGRYLTDEETVSRSFLIAQDVQAVLPEAVDASDDEDKTLMLRYTDVIPLLVSAIQELKAELDAAKADIATLKGAA